MPFADYLLCVTVMLALSAISGWHSHWRKASEAKLWKQVPRWPPGPAGEGITTIGQSGNLATRMRRSSNG
jgi:hypothetical protein